jgi:hypothetical protein
MITGAYQQRMAAYLNDLDVSGLKLEAYANIASTISETGSDRPRALLAYYYSILHTIQQFGGSAFCPIVIDSPNQQGQDPNSLRKMIEFICREQPPESQLILGAEELLSIKTDGEVIELVDKHRVLNEADYESVMDELIPLLDASFMEMKNVAS